MELGTLVPLILGGGLLGAIATLVTSRAMAHKTRAEAAGVAAKTPAEVDSIVVQGAEAAVLTMRSALESATARIAELEADRARDRQRIAELEQRLDELRLKVDRAERALGEAREAGLALRAELASLRRDSDRRP